MPYTRVTLAELLQNLQDRWEGQRFWTSAEGTVYLNHSLRAWNLLTGMWKRKVWLQTPAGSPWVELPGSLTYATVVQVGSHPALGLTSISELDRLRPAWRKDLAGSSGMPQRPRRWAPAGLKLFAVWPCDPVGGAALLVDGVAATPTLTLPTDYVDIGDQEHEAIVAYAHVISSFKRGAGTFQATMQLRLPVFLQAAADQNNRLKNSAFYKRAMGLDHRGGRPVVEFTPAGPPPDKKG